MTLVRALVCTVGLVIALAPTMSAFAVGDSDHLQAELENAAAQYQLALQQADAMQAQATLNQQNELMIGFLQTEAMRQKTLGEAANGNAIEGIAATLANAARKQGDLNAINELIILQNRAAVLVAKADDDIKNAMAIGRADEIANANAKSVFLHHLADTITSVLAETNMSNARQIGQMQADAIHGPALAQAANGQSLAAAEVLAADEVLAAAQIGGKSATVQGATKANNIISHAAASMANARAQLAAGQ